MGVYELLIIVFMIFFNAIFAGYELALTSINLGRLKLLAEQKKKGAKAAVLMKTKMESSLAVIQIGITLVAGIAAATGGAGAEETISPLISEYLNISEGKAVVISIILVVLPLSSITIVLGELVPKTLSIKNNEFVCLLLSPVMKKFSFIVFPAVILFEWVTKKIVKIFELNKKNELMPAGLAINELRAFARALRTNEIIGREQEKIIIGASNLYRIKVKDILIPEEDIVTLHVDGNLPDHFVTIHLEGFTRFPVTQKSSDIQTIIGYVTIKELIFLAKTNPDNPSLRAILRPIISFEAETRIGEAFSVMMKEHHHLALIRDKENQVLGMITLEDILEEVVGDIVDESDRLPKYIKNIGDKFMVGGGAPLAMVFEKINYTKEIPQEKTNMNFNEWVQSDYNKKISGGDLIRIGSLEILVRKVRRNHILEAIVEKVKI